VTDTGVFVGLPRDLYLSEDQFERELERLFTATWQYACHSSQIADPGQFLVREVGPNESLIVTRAEDGRVRALFNVCRHRGSRICDTVTGNAKRFTCPYHQWTYGLDGRLLGAPRLRDGEGLDYADHGLHEAQASEWRGHVFVNLSPTPASPIAAELEAMCGDLGAFAPERCRVAHEAVYSVNANWKVLLENFWECYHCATGHLELCRTMDVSALYDAEFGTLFDETPPQVERAGLPLKPNAATVSMDGELVSTALLGSFSGGPVPTPAPTSGFILRATTAASYFVDYGIIHDFRPVSVDQTNVLCQWIVRGDAVEGRDYEHDRLVELWETTNRQDWPLCERNFAGMRSTRFTPGPQSMAWEPGIRAFHQYYDGLMGHEE